jgi:dTDP-4-amino-4,6-dideoxygalactose transaminase
VIRLAVPDIDDSDVEAVAEVLRSGYLVQGTHVRTFEERIAGITGARHAVAVSSGTAALHLALLALDIGAGDEVAVASYSWPATANVVALVGATAVFVDVDPRTGNIAPDALAAALRQRPAVRAVLPVHVFGCMADMEAVTQIAARHGAAVIEDAACALGAASRGRAAGTWGRVGCFSFHPRKAVTTGEGGAVTTDDSMLADRLRALRNHGLDPTAATPNFVMPGLNYRMTDFQGALGTAQLRKLDRIIERRRQLAASYGRLLDSTGVQPPAPPETSAHVFQSYVVRLPSEAAQQRDGIIAWLRANGIESTIGTHHLPLTTYWRRVAGHQPGDFPGADDVAARAITLPLHTRLTEDEQIEVVGALTRALAEHQNREPQR